MINTALNKSDLLYLLIQQEKLDSSMRDKHDIKKSDWMDNMHMEHDIALNVEVHEFINEAYQTWKYWKTKKMNLENMLEEAIDVIHFLMLAFNKQNPNHNKMAKELSIWLTSSTQLKDRGEVKKTILQLSTEQRHAILVLERVLKILDYSGFNSVDIINAYNKKNKVNFERMVDGY